MELNQEQLRKLQTETLFRSVTFERGNIDQEARTAEVAFSSEEPYQRWFGTEILGHASGEVDMKFLSSGTAPLLADHDTRDQIGVIEKAWIDSDLKGRAIVRFGKSERASEIFQDVVDGIRGNVSVGYRVKTMKLVSSDKKAGDTYRVTKWQPLETSIVAVPADTTVGVGRSAEEIILPIEVKKMAEITDVIDTEKIKVEARTAETSRIRDIIALGEMHGFKKEAQEAIANGKDLDQFRQQVLDGLQQKGLKPVETKDATIGMNEKETQDFSFVRAIRALANPTDRRMQEEAKFEFEASRAVSEKMQKPSGGIMIPLEVMKRDLTAGTASAGGNTVAINLLGESFITILTNRMAINRMGAKMLTGLTGNVAIPRQTGGATSYWVAENAAPTESQQVFDQVALSPKTVGAFTDISRRLLKQSSIDVENFVRSDIALQLALAIDSAAINGLGSSNQPLGILNTSGIGAVAGGTNGLIPTWGNITALWAAVSAANADFGALGFLTNSKVIGKMMTVEKAASSAAQFVVMNFPDDNGITSMGGVKCAVSNQVPSNLTKGTSTGVCSAIIFGNFLDLIVGMWGTLDLVVDPYSQSSQGTVRVVALQDVDVAVRHPESFAAMKDALTV